MQQTLQALGVQSAPQLTPTELIKMLKGTTGGAAGFACAVSALPLDVVGGRGAVA
jgi:hypothetical protein